MVGAVVQAHTSSLAVAAAAAARPSRTSVSSFDMHACSNTRLGRVAFENGQSTSTPSPLVGFSSSFHSSGVVGRHSAVQLSESTHTPSQPGTSTQNGHLVILGSGWGSFRLLKSIDTNKFAKVTVISPRNHFLYTPLLPSTTTGTLEFRCIAEPIRYAKDDVDYIMAEATELDAENQRLTARAVLDDRVFDIPYDQLVIGVGALPATFGIPGVEEHTHFLKELGDARNIRQHVIENFERAAEPNVDDDERKRLLHFVVVGGGPTGSEWASELADFIRFDIRRHYPELLKDVRVSLVDGSDRVLGAFGDRLSRYAKRTMQKHQIHLLLGSNVDRVEEKRIVLKNGTVLDYGMCVWSTGLDARPMIKDLPFPKTRDNRLLVNEFLEIADPHVRNIYAIGDCSQLQGDAQLAPTAQAAQQEGAYLAKLLNHRATHGIDADDEPFKYRHFGMLAYIGGYKGLTDIGNLKTGGFASWVVWRSAYFSYLVSWRNRLLVPMHWFKTFVFGRDVTRF